METLYFKRWSSELRAPSSELLTTRGAGSGQIDLEEFLHMIHIANQIASDKAALEGHVNTMQEALAATYDKIERFDKVGERVKIMEDNYELLAGGAFENRPRPGGAAA
jgi:hypothetical protein